jgi:lambda repressor-like predicted transcriptional regulator
MDSTSRRTPNQLVGKLRSRGLTLERFAQRYGFSARTVKAAVHGERRGKVCQEILAQIRRVTRNAA